VEAEYESDGGSALRAPTIFCANASAGI
jgi:hypothetical protein